MLQAGALPDSLNVDGVLDEPAWMSAPITDAFTQTDPAEGSMPSARTTVRVLAGTKALVIGVVCDDPDPSGSSASAFGAMRRSAGRSPSHRLDPFLDARSGYVFAVNPSGARYDALINPGDASENADWDGIWEAATKRTPTGWVGGDPHSDTDTCLQARPARVAFQRAAPHSTFTRNRSMGVPGASISGDADQPRGAADRTARVHARSRP